MRILKTGDPCPFCGQPPRQTDPDALRLLAAIADIVGLPKRKEEAESIERRSFKAGTAADFH